MTPNQFTYTRTVTRPAKKEGEEPTVTTYEDSFNINKVIRTVSIPGGKLIVLLDDGHEASQEVPFRNKAGKIEPRRERAWLQSELELNPEDAARYRAISTISSPTLAEQL